MSVNKRILQCTVTGNDRRDALPVRVSVFDAAHRYYAPADALIYGYGLADGWPADWGIRGIQKYFYADGFFLLEIPCGALMVKIAHGLEYETFEVEIASGSEPVNLRVELKRVIDMPKLGWYCGDNHCHYNHEPIDYALTEDEGLFYAAAEGLNHVCFLSKKLLQPALIESDGSETTGHFSFECGHHPVLNVAVRPPPELTCTINDRDEWFSLNDWVRAHGGVIIMGHPLFANHLYSALMANDRQAAHMTHYEIPVNAMLGKVDTFELQNNRQSILATWLMVWYRLLNCGINLPLSAGTDACLSVKTTLPVGAYRSYVQAEDRKFAAYLEGLKAGRSFITDGPLLFFKVNGTGPGGHLAVSSSVDRLQIEFQVKSIFPLPWLELIKNGEVVGRWELDGTKEFEGTCELQVDRSCWLALRVLRLRRKTADSEETELFAHTNPVYVDFDTRPRSSSQDALFFLQWLEAVKKYRIGIDNQPAIEAIAAAAQKYEAQLNEGDVVQWRWLKSEFSGQNLAEFLTDDFIMIDPLVRLKKENLSPYDIEFIVKSVDVEPGRFYRLSARCRMASSINDEEAGGQTYGKIVIFDAVGTYLGSAECNFSSDISTLIYLPEGPGKLQIAYCLASPGHVEFAEVKIVKFEKGMLEIK